MEPQFKYILFNKPFDVLCQFTDGQGRKTLKDFIDIPDVYPAGRLDQDSEGLVFLTNDNNVKTNIIGKIDKTLGRPVSNLMKRYWVQVEGVPDNNALKRLRDGIMIQDYKTLPAMASIIEEPNIWEREKPIRFRKNIPTSWLEIGIVEGHNRQVRHMTAAVGHPTLRLIRFAIGQYELKDLLPGQFRILKKLPLK